MADRRESERLVTLSALAGLLCVTAWGCTEGPPPGRESSQPIDVRSPTPASAPAIDASAIGPFWQIVDTLSQDFEPSPRLWRALFDTPGYRALTRTEFEPHRLQEGFRLAYMPSRADRLDGAVESGGESRRLRHYRQVLERRTELEAFAGELTASEIGREPSRLAAEWLPGPAPDSLAPIALVVFDLDARGYDPIVVDLLAARELDLVPFLAHESHHWFRNDRATVDWEAVDTNDAETLWTLYQIQGEGIADQIDKRPWIEGTVPVPEAFRSYGKQYALELIASPETLRRLDSLLVAHGKAAGRERAEIGARVADLIPMSGHPTGYHMARTILEAGGRERLVADVTNPVAFFRAYDEAARTLGRPGLSPEALASLDALEPVFSP